MNYYEINNDFCLSLIGHKMEEVFDLCDENNIRYRVVKKDSIAFIITRDYISERINFEITKGIITNAYTG